MRTLLAAPLHDPAALHADRGAAVWWLGQAGFMVSQGGLRIVIDAYLSDSLAEKYRGRRFPHTRMMAPPVAPGALTGVDWLLCTHGHTDHMDPGTIPALLSANPAARVLAPRAEAERAVERGVPEDRLVLIDIGETVDLGGVLATATPAAHETMARTGDGHLFLGYVLSGGGVTLWHSGDTIPWTGQVEWLAPFRVDLALLPVNGRDGERAANGVPGNLTLAEAVRLADSIGARAMIAHHFGLFDFNTIDPAAARGTLAGLDVRAEVVLAELFLAWHVAPVSRKALSVLLVGRGNGAGAATAMDRLAARLPGLSVGCAALDARGDEGPDRAVVPADFRRFDLILATDDQALAALSTLRPADATAVTGHLGAYVEAGSIVDLAGPEGPDPAAATATNAAIDAATAGLARLIGRIAR